MTDDADFEAEVKRKAMELYAADGMKHASEHVSLEQSWEMSPRFQREYLEKARAALLAANPI